MYLCKFGGFAGCVFQVEARFTQAKKIKKSKEVENILGIDRNFDEVHR